MQKCYGWGSLTNYKVRNYHISPPSFLHLLFTLQITKSTQVFLMFVLLLHIQSPPTPHIRNTKATVYFCLPKIPPAFLKEATFPLKGTTEQLQNEANQQSLPVPCDFSRLCSVKALPGDLRRLKLHSSHSSISKHVWPGPACGHGEAF